MDWNIRAHAHACQVSGEPFKDGDSYHTLLVYAGREGYQRLDVCERVWNEQFSDNASQREGYVSHWQGTYRVPPPPPPEPIKKENAESLLRKLVELGDERYLEATYILAVMLERKRILKVRDQLMENGRRTFVYEHVKTKEMFTIPDMNLRLDQLEAVQREVAHLLEHGFDEPRTPRSPEEEETSPAAEDSSESSRCGEGEETGEEEEISHGEISEESPASHSEHGRY